MIIGREREQESLERAFNDRESQFIAIYGRKRVGKTYLIHEFFKQKKCTYFHVTGLRHGKLKDQLDNFMKAFSRTFHDGVSLRVPYSWNEALRDLTRELERTNEKAIVFFDELSLMATRKSGLMSALDSYWNNQWSGMTNVIFVACSSSVSWMHKNIINHTGGFHNRTTQELHLRPLRLWETREYLHSKKIELDDKDTLQLSMAVGGIPYYLNPVKPNLSAQQNIQHLFFDEHAPLDKEYFKLFEALYDKANPYKELMELIGQKKDGISRNELIKHAQLSTKGGELSERLNKLCEEGLIKSSIPWGKTKGAYYKVVDESCLFYIHWVKGSKKQALPPDHWLAEVQRPAYHTWSQYAYEAVCSKHIHQIIRGLNIHRVNEISSWHSTPKAKAQFSLVLVGDDAITVCETNYADEPFAFDKSYAMKLQQKIDLFRKQTKTDKRIFLGMVTAYGFKESPYSEELVSGVVTLEDLFKP